ncbi:MAG: succinate dehydrogenase cytochrome b subunit [Candidatus Omnitrophica bacterium]|nr:succinate dehydrogenase cytochrome b subunit [Candidatus Omnitrophota bacterium]
MSSESRCALRSSILRKQIVAVTGLILTGFLAGHLAGNFLIFLGPEAFNGYSEKLHAIPELLWLVRLGLIAAFLIHVITTILLTLENRQARGERYAVNGSKSEESLKFAKKTMIYTGLLVLFFLVLHLSDFTLSDKEGPASMIAAGEGNPPRNLGLYGLVWNSFLEPWRAGVYIAVMLVLGLHLSHGIQSLCQTLGFYRNDLVPRIRKLSLVLGLLAAIGFSSVPLFINIVRTPPL